SNLESPRCSRPVEELPGEPPDACPRCLVRPTNLMSRMNGKKTYTTHTHTGTTYGVYVGVPSNCR
ncbi:unnamed protein product, partial [Ascophyllum nodosum]